MTMMIWTQFIPSNILHNGASPWINVALSILRARPTPPTMSTRLGEVTISRWKKRSIDCKKMDNPSARRKTPLKKAPCVEHRNQLSDLGRKNFIPTNSAR